MDLVFELINSTGKVLERYKVSDEKISIGRAYDNDIILTDLSVSPHHAKLTITDDGKITVNDLQSENGIRDSKRNIIRSGNEISSGDELNLGNARVRLYKSDHPVAVTKNLGGFNKICEIMSRTSVGIIAFSFIFILILLQVWLSTYDEFNWGRYVQSVLPTIIVIVCLALFWALVGKIAKHEMFFKVQLTAIAIYFCIQVILTFINEIVLYNTLSLNISMVFQWVLGLLFLGLMFWFNLYVSTNQNSFQRWAVAVPLAIVFLLLSYLDQFLESDEFSLTPEYVADVKPPIFKLRTGVVVEELLANSESIYRHKDIED